MSARGPRKVQLTEHQRQQVEQARALAGAEAEQIAGLGDIGPANDAVMYATALGPHPGHRHRPAGHHRRDHRRCVMSMGPFESEQQARETPAVRAVFEAYAANPGVGRMAGHSHQLLLRACSAASVDLGAYDRRILAWLGGFEPTTCVVIAGLISRAHDAAGDASLDG